MSFRILLAYKNFAASKGVSHIGLGVAALNCAKVLNSLGAPTEVLAVATEVQLRQALNIAKSQGTTYTHVIVSAPWVSTTMYQWLCANFPTTQFAMCCHSNVGFLQADRNGIRLLKEGLDLETQTWNFRVAANCERLKDFVVEAYGRSCLYLPNLYWIDPNDQPQVPWQGGQLRVGIFGATRPLKNLLSGVGGAMIMARALRVDTQIWLSKGRDDVRGTITDAAEELARGVPGVEIKYVTWAPWPQFRQTVGNMHLLMQPSYTESFNMVTADGASQYVPSVVSSAIDWAPDEAQADVDDADDIARAGIGLLYDRFAGRRANHALKAHNREGVQAWSAWLRSTGTFDHYEMKL